MIYVPWIMYRNYVPWFMYLVLCSLIYVPWIMYLTYLSQKDVIHIHIHPPLPHVSAKQLTVISDILHLWINSLMLTMSESGGNLHSSFTEIKSFVLEKDLGPKRIDKKYSNFAFQLSVDDLLFRMVFSCKKKLSAVTRSTRKHNLNHVIVY